MPSNRSLGSGLAIDRVSWLAFAFVVASAIALRFYEIDHLPGINGDEPQYAVHATEWLNGAPIGTLRTGSDLPMNPVFFGTVVLLQRFLPSSLWTLRLAAVVQSLLAIALAYALFQKRGRTFASIFAGLVAVLPAHLGYARLAVDPAAIPTVVVLALSQALSLRVVPTVFAFALALWVHPTTVFVLPVLLAPFVVAWWPRRGNVEVQRTARALAAVALLAVIATGALLSLLLAQDLLPEVVARQLRSDLPGQIFERASQPMALLEFAGAYVNLLSGVPIYRHVTALLSDAAAHLHFIVAVLLLFPLGIAALRRLYLEGRTTDLGVTGALGIAIALEYLIAGPSSLAPSTARYGLCLTIPGCYVIASWIDVLASTRFRASALRAGTAVVGAALLLSFCVNYLAALHRPAPNRENTFRTGPVDPKRLALAEVTRMRDPDRITVVYAEDWWIYWTLRYLAPPETGMRITIDGQRWWRAFPQDFVLPRYDAARMEAFAVVWAGGCHDARFSGPSVEHVDVHGYEPCALLRVHRLSAPESSPSAP